MTVGELRRLIKGVPGEVEIKIIGDGKNGKPTEWSNVVAVCDGIQYSAPSKFDFDNPNREDSYVLVT